MPHPGTLAALVPPGEAGMLRRIEDLERAQREMLPAVMSAVGPMFAEIQDAADAASAAAAAASSAAAAANQAVSDLAIQVARINTLVDAQVTGATNTTYVASPSLTPTPAAIAAVSIAVPAGYSRASVMAVSALSTANAVNCRTRIQGSDGGMLTGATGTASSAHAVSLSGLNGGVITAWTLAAANPSTTSGMANTTIMALFFR